MPTAKIHVHEGRYDEQRLAKLGHAIQGALESVLTIPPEDYYRIVHVLPPHSFVHTPSFLGLTYSEDFVLLELTFIAGRPKETRLALLKELNDRVVAATGISPDDLCVLIYELPGENVSFGQAWHSGLISLPAVHLHEHCMKPASRRSAEASTTVAHECVLGSAHMRR